MFQSFRFQNPGPGQMIVRVELWCVEYALAPGSSLTLRCLVGIAPQIPTIEWTTEGLTFWPECFSYSAEIDGVPCKQGAWASGNEAGDSPPPGWPDRNTAQAGPRRPDRDATLPSPAPRRV